MMAIGEQLELTKTNKKASTSKNYQGSESPVDKVETDEFESRDVWLSAYLLAFGCELVRVVPVGPRRSRFVHRNAHDFAWALSQEWREGINAMVNGPALMRAYKEVLNRARNTESFGENNRHEHYETA